MTVILWIWGRGPRSLSAGADADLRCGCRAGQQGPHRHADASTPTPTPHTYTVQGGDTLFSIARDQGIEPEALMAANGLSDPDRLSVGQVLTIPELSSGPDASGVDLHPRAGDAHATAVRFSGPAP